MKYHQSSWFVYALLNYNLNVIGIVKYSDTAYRIKCKEMDVMLKKISYQQIPIIEKVAKLQLPFVEQVILNNQKKAVSEYLDEYYYLSVYLKDLYFDIIESKKYFSQLLSSLHSQSVEIEVVEKGYFESIIMMFKEDLNRKQAVDNELFINNMRNEFISPSYWIYLYFKDIGIPYFNDYYNAIMNYEKISCNINTIRRTINFNHFNYHNLDYNRKLLLGMHKANYDNVVFDICAWITNNFEPSIIDSFNDYLCCFSLCEEEKYLLICMLYYSINICISENEINNIKEIIAFSKKLKIIKSIKERLNLQNCVDI